jgi:hypothetical protein
MQTQVLDDGTSQPASAASTGLRDYYLLRVAVSAAWVAAAFTAGKASPAIGAVLLVAYPAWDALANLIDARRSGGLSSNPTQFFNVGVSGITALAVAVTLGDMNTVLAVFGAWAILAGLLQLATGVRRWKAYGAQWAMILSGAQSAVAGGLFIKRSLGAAIPSVTDVAPYAAVGAFYFLVSALLLTFRRKTVA